jgi:pimeloyl-ACP methyl ester carboxylesterase
VIYDRLVRLFREYYKDCFDSGMIAEYRVDYKGTSLPVWYARCAQGETRGTIVVSGGFDCYKEELIPVILYFADRGFDTYYFEGPGQGEVLLKSKLPMTHEWEKPMGAVLDRFNLSDVTLIGLSLGGYLAPRAAVYEPRIKRVVAWGTMYDFYRVVSTRRGVVLGAFIDVLTVLKLAPVLNFLVSIKMRFDPYIFWGVDHGMHVMGASTPYESNLQSRPAFVGDVQNHAEIGSGRWSATEALHRFLQSPPASASPPTGVTSSRFGLSSDMCA